MYRMRPHVRQARLNLGIRRRLAPLVGNERIELMCALLFSLPGTPVIYYGDEIGMGENIYLGDRNGVRTPMQWTPDRNGGFSRCDPARLYLPIIMDPVYGYESINVEAQSRSLGSLLSWTKRLIAVRKASKVFGRGSLTFLRPANRSVLAYIRQLDDEIILSVANLSRSAQAAEIDLSRWHGRQPMEAIGRTAFPPIEDRPYLITLAPYGFFWLRLCEPVAPTEAPSIAPEFHTLVIANDWQSLLWGRSRSVLERDVLPAFLSGRRWCAEHGSLSLSATVLRILFAGHWGSGRCIGSHPSRRRAGNRALFDASDHSVDEIRSRFADAECALRRSPRPARGNAAGRVDKRSVHFAHPRQSPPIGNVRCCGTGTGVPGHRRLRPRAPRSDRKRASRGYGTIQHDRSGQLGLRGQAVSPCRARNQS